MWRASPFPPPCNGDLHSDFRIRVPFGRNWSDLLLVERLHPREKMTHRTCLVFFLLTFLTKGKQASQSSTIIKYLLANPAFFYCIASAIDAAYQPVIRDVFVRELVVTVRIHPIIPEGRSYNGIVQVIVLSKPSPATVNMYVEINKSLRKKKNGK